MSGASDIEWTDATWNPIRGCSRVSEGCRNCYAERVAARFSKPGGRAELGGGTYPAQPYHGLAEMTAAGPRWTGKVRLIEEHLEDPIRWKRPRRIFVNSMSDLFHESLDFSVIADIFNVMCDERSEKHTFQILTKRPERMVQFFRGWVGEYLSGDTPLGVNLEVLNHPGKNIWIGVSCEDQTTADKRIPLLLKTPAAVRFVSYEPALGPIDFRPFVGEDITWSGTGYIGPIPRLDWVIIGGESGSGARPFCIDWADDVIWKCRAASVDCFFKQMGRYPYTENANRWDFPKHVEINDGDGSGAARGSYKLRSPKGNDPAEWPTELRVREFPR